MKNFYDKKGKSDWKGNGKGGYKGGFKSGKKFGDRAGGSSWGRREEDDGERRLFRATCNACEASCEVPFKPNGKKPVYCSDCFRKEEGSDASPRRGSREMSFDLYEDRPSYEKPAYRSTPRVENGNEDVVRQLKTLNAKMDTLLEALANFRGGSQE